MPTNNGKAENILLHYTRRNTAAAAADAEQFYCWQQWVPVKRVRQRRIGNARGETDISFQNWFPGMCALSLFG